jgi:hypothetical protein
MVGAFRQVNLENASSDNVQSFAELFILGEFVGDACY